MATPIAAGPLDRRVGGLDSTFDDRLTHTRMVYANGILAYNIPERVIPMMRDGRGNKVEMLPFGHFPDLPASISWRHEDDGEPPNAKLTGVPPTDATKGG